MSIIDIIECGAIVALAVCVILLDIQNRRK